MTDLEKAMETLILVFHRYSSEDGDGKTLSHKELKKLLETELPAFLKTQKDPATVDKIMKDLDASKDKQLDFEEFVPLVVGLSNACEQCYQMHMKKTAKK